MNATLELRGLVKSFGGLRAVDDVSLDVQPASITGIIGPNGSGKTTLLGMVAGTHTATAGTVTVGGRDVTRLSAHRRVRAGIARTFQTTRLLRSWTVRESMKLAALGASNQSTSWLEHVAEMTELEDQLDATTGRLTSSAQRLVMIACALASRPSVLLLDEPAVGMDVAEAEHLHDVLRRVRGELEVTVLLVEHNMRFLMSLADTVVVMAEGRLLAEGTPDIIRNDPAVIAAYLGG